MQNTVLGKYGLLIKERFKQRWPKACMTKSFGVMKKCKLAEFCIAYATKLTLISEE